MEMENGIISLHNISKEYSGVTVLNNIDLVIEKNKVYGLAGENGAGKSTLCNIIAGSIPPSRGHIELEGKKFERLSLEKAKASGIRMVQQELQVIPDLSIAENIFVGNEIQRNGWIKKKEMYQRTSELLEKVGLRADPRTNVRNVDIAARQLIEIARANNSDANLIILDEPTSSLSDKEVEKLFEIMRRQCSEGMSFIFVSHRLEELFDITDEIIVLKDGNMVSKIKTEETNEAEIIKMMVGRSYSDLYKRERKNFGEEVLRLENVSGISAKKFTNAYTPTNINLKLHAGEVLGIAGLVGAGRTELVKIIFGIDKMEPEGKVFLFNEEVKIRHSFDAIKKKMVWVTEDRKNLGLVLKFDIKKNITMPIIDRMKEKIFISKSKEIEVTKEYIEKLQIKTTGMGQLIKYLSGGNQQKVVISKWLATSPKIMILDEPTRGIDVGTKAEIYKLINNLTENGVAIILISSELPEVMGMSDRIIVLYEGKISGELNSNDFSEESIMHYATGRTK